MGISEHWCFDRLSYTEVSLSGRWMTPPGIVQHQTQSLIQNWLIKNYLGSKFRHQFKEAAFRCGFLDLYQTRKQQWNSTMFRLHRWILRIDIRRTTDSWTFSFRSTPPTPPSTWIAQPMCFREDFALAGDRGTKVTGNVLGDFASARCRSDFSSGKKNKRTMFSLKDYSAQKWSFKGKQITVFFEVWRFIWADQTMAEEFDGFEWEGNVRTDCFNWAVIKTLVTF